MKAMDRNKSGCRMIEIISLALYGKEIHMLCFGSLDKSRK